MSELISIRDAALLLNKSESLIYRYIRNGKLNIQNCSELIQGKFRTVKKLDKEELIKISTTANERSSEPSSEHRFNIGSELVQNVDIRGMIEAEATYRLGRLEERYINLETENNKLLNELKMLQEQMKALPDQKMVQELQDKLNQEEDTKLKLQKQIELLPAKPEEVKEILMNNADNLKALQQENSNLKATFEIRLEKELELQIQLSKAMEEKEEALKAMSQAAEKEKIEIAEAWQKKVYEMSRPWWKFW